MMWFSVISRLVIRSFAWAGLVLLERDAFGQGSDAGGLRPGEVRVGLNFELRLVSTPQKDPDPFADRVTAGGAGMIRISGAFAAQLRAPQPGRRRLAAFRLLGNGLVGDLENLKDRHITEIFGEGGWSRWPSGEIEEWRAKGTPLSLPNFSLEMDLETNGWILSNFGSTVDGWFNELTAAQSFSGNYYDLSPGGAGYKSSALPKISRDLEEALILSSDAQSGFAKLAKPQVLVGSLANLAGMGQGVFAAGELRGGWSMDWKIESAPANLELRVTAPKYEDWIPNAHIDKQSGDIRPGTPLAIAAEVIDPDGKVPVVRIKKLTWKLVETSREPGLALNLPWRSSDTSPDLEIGKRGPSLEKKQELIEEDLTQLKSMAKIVPWDFGGWSTLRVEAVLDDGRTLMGKFKGPGPNNGKTDILLPDRDPSSKIQRKWRQLSNFSDPDSSDEDRFPAGKSTSLGDGFSAYEEYRGFYISAIVGSQKLPPPSDRRHLRLKPNFRNVFFFDEMHSRRSWSAMGLFESASRAPSFVLWREDELMDESSALNLNRGAGPTQGDQHAVRIATFQNESHRGLAVGNRPGRGSVSPPSFLGINRNTPKDYDSITDSFFKRALAQGLLGSCGVPNPGGLDEDSFVGLIISRGADGGPEVRTDSGERVTYQDEGGRDLGEDWLKEIDAGRSSVARVLRGHLGAYEAADAAAEALARRRPYVARKGGLHSGPLNNIMRDTFANAYWKGPSSIVQLPKGYKHPVGLSLSETSLSDEPLNRFGDSPSSAPAKEFTPNDHR